MTSRYGQTWSDTQILQQMSRILRWFSKIATWNPYRTSRFSAIILSRDIVYPVRDSRVTFQSVIKFLETQKLHNEDIIFTPTSLWYKSHDIIPPGHISYKISAISSVLSTNKQTLGQLSTARESSENTSQPCGHTETHTIAYISRRLRTEMNRSFGKRRTCPSYSFKLLDVSRKARDLTTRRISSV